MSQKTILVTGSSGFIGGHLTRRLIEQGHYVVGVDLVPPPYFTPNKFYQYDLRVQKLVEKVFIDHLNTKMFDEVYNLACLMGGMGYIGSHEHDYDIMVGSSQIVSNINECCVAFNVPKIFYSSSACVYNMTKQDQINSPALKESDCYPAMPDLVYGWQKLFSEHMMDALRSKDIEIRIARFHNIFGPYGTFDGGKEKAPAALCRKVAQANDANKYEDGIDRRFIEVWGDGSAQRSFLYIDECLDGVQRLMESDYCNPVNIGSDEVVSINRLAQMIIDISGKNLKIKNIPSSNVGVQARNSDNSLIKEVLGWCPSKPLKEGLEKTYEWINEQVQGNLSKATDNFITAMAEEFLGIVKKNNP